MGALPGACVRLKSADSADMIKLSSDGHSRYPHCVTWTEGEKRRRKYFKEYRAAQKWMARKAAHLRLIPQGEPPAAPDEFRAILEARREGIPLMDALHHWKRTVGASGGRTLSDLIDARLKAAKADNISQRHLEAIARKLERLREALGSLPAVGVTAADVAPLIYSEQTHGSQRHSRAIFTGVFTHAMRMGWLQSNPVATLKPQRKPPAAPPAVFTVEEAADWLCCVAAHAPACLAGWAVAMFAGLRRAEVERLDWSEVKLSRGFVEVTAAKAKTGSRRLVEIQPNLASILEPLAGEGRVFPLSPKRHEAWAFRAYGKQPPKNAARHSFVSYHLALYENTEQTALQAGHGREILFRHYRELVTKQDAEEYFSITV